MEFQFNKTELPCLKQILRECSEQEVTQEIKLSDSMPDVGRVLAAWGQVLIRGKEWRSGEICVSGGVLVSILYAPEDGSEPRCMDGWMPLQMKWGIPDTPKDGIILASGTLVNLDARTVSARKILARANVGMMVRGMIPEAVPIYTPGELPEDIQILERSYPMKIPKEAGEKVFLLDEELSLPSSAPPIQKILRYCVHPDLIDRKVMADKVVFRGIALVHILYATDEGKLESVDLELPFSQYKDLDYTYEQNADSQVCVAVTSLELDRGTGDCVYVKAGMVGQYVVYDTPVITIAEDAYSTVRDVTVQTDILDLPAVLDTQGETLRASAELEAKGLGQVVDMSFMMGCPTTERQNDGMQVQVPGRFLMLYYNEDGALDTASERWKGEKKINLDSQGNLDAWAWLTGKAHANPGIDNANARSDIHLTMVTTGTQGIGMITGLTAEEAAAADPNRPSLILRRAGEADLWQIAKQCRSTVDAIKTANGLQEEPEAGRYLLIPMA